MKHSTTTAKNVQLKVTIISAHAQFTFSISSLSEFLEMLLYVQKKLNVSLHCLVNLNKNSSGDEIANVNFDTVRPEGTRIR